MPSRLAEREEREATPGKKQKKTAEKENREKHRIVSPVNSDSTSIKSNSRRSRRQRRGKERERERERER